MLALFSLIISLVALFWIFSISLISPSLNGHQTVKVNENDTFVPERKYQLVSRYNYRTVSKKGLYQRCKCIGDDTKAAARRSPNCIKKTKK